MDSPTALEIVFGCAAVPPSPSLPRNCFRPDTCTSWVVVASSRPMARCASSVVTVWGPRRLAPPPSGPFSMLPSDSPTALEIMFGCAAVPPSPSSPLPRNCFLVFVDSSCVVVARLPSCMEPLPITAPPGTCPPRAPSWPPPPPPVARGWKLW